MPPTERRGSLAYELETAQGIRRVEFDADVFRRRDVRILVDGQCVASLAFPKPASPYQEVAFQIDGHDLIGVAWLPTESWPDGLPLRYDVVANGRSLVDGAALDEVRQSAPAPGAPYPRGFYMLDITLRIAPVAATPGLLAGVGRGVDQLGWQRAVALAVLLLASVWTASWLGAQAWRRIRADRTMTVRRRVALGWIAVGACYAAAIAGVVGLFVAARS